MSKHDTASNNAQAARAKAEQAAGNPYDQAEGGTEKKKANLKQAGEKLKGHRQEVRGRARAVDVTQAFTVTSAAGGGEAVRPPAGHTGVL